MTPKLPTYDWTAKDRLPVFAWIIRTAQQVRYRQALATANDYQIRQLMERLNCAPVEL